MIFLLLPFLICSLKVSDMNVRLPVYSEKEGRRPYKIINFFQENIEFEVENSQYLDLEVISQNSTITVINVSVKYSENHPVSTNIKLKIDDSSSNYPIFIDTIDHISIFPSTNTIGIKHLAPFKIVAYNNKNETFSSLNGIEIKWGPSLDEREFGLFLPSDPVLKTYYDSIPSDYVIVKGAKNGIFKLICELPNQKVQPATYSFKVTSPILFSPNEIYTVENGVIEPALYYIRENGEILRPLNLSDSDYVFESDSPDVAEVSSNGQVTTKKLGNATITVTDKNNFSKPAKVVIHVIYPDDFEWDDQWIKPSDEPEITNMTVYYRNNVVTFPINSQVKIYKNYQNIGTNVVKATFTDFDYTIQGKVHNCPAPEVDQEYIKVIVGENNRFIIKGGSGYFDFDYDYQLITVHGVNSEENKENGYVMSGYVIEAKKEGKTVIHITDKKINDYTTELEVESFNKNAANQDL